MPRLPQGPSMPLKSGTPRSGPALIPCLLLKAGEVCLPGPDGPLPARTPDGSLFDPFDVIDRLSPRYSLLYVVDLDGIERADPQLDYVQEIARDMTLWVDAGVRTADQAIDVLVAGAHRAVLSSAYLQGPRQLSRAWKLSTELAFEVELSGSHLSPPAGDWGTQDPLELVRTVRATGPDHVIVSPREKDPDWGLVQSVAAGGPTWVDGSFSVRDAPRLSDTGASGGIFHLDELLAHWEEESK
jgi:hypothetical protein